MNVNINALDGMGSLLWTNDSSGTQGFAYSPFGNTDARSGGDSLLPGFNGERLDPVSQTYHLGNGYRTYNPTLMRFNAPDSWSPFGSGGFNQYAYCEGDPINRSDPSGHMSTGSAVRMGLGIFLGILGAVLSGGISIAVEGSIAAGFAAMTAADWLTTGLGVASTVAGVASGATQESDPEASKVLGWVSFGLGMAAFTTHAANSAYTKLRQLQSGSIKMLRTDRMVGADSSGTEFLTKRQLGPALDLYEAPTNSGLINRDRLIVDADGMRDKNVEWVRLPENTEGRFFGPDGVGLWNPTLHSLSEDMVAHYELISAGGYSQNYTLGRYAKDTPRMGDTFAKMHGVDILMINGDALANTELVLLEIKQAGLHYSRIDFAHCRSLRGTPLNVLIRDSYRPRLKEGFSTMV